ncbi:MAG TPA: TusE/DsrC/DsvC family sulfur relay protein [Myxococcota bacterium]|nr:TusE/DsrC/DsvC family sulfur relay protein [Myxococcota bacterium]
MPIVDYRGTPLELSEDGFLASPRLWDAEVALFMAKRQGLEELGKDHWAVLDYIRGFYEEHGLAPLVRKICRTTGLKLKYIYQLFPAGPAMGACKVAGLPNSDGCV